MSQDLLESRWGETKDALLEGLGGSKRNSMSVILENTRKYLKRERKFRFNSKWKHCYPESCYSSSNPSCNANRYR